MKKFRDLFSNVITLTVLLILGIGVLFFLSNRSQSNQPTTQVVQATKAKIVPTTVNEKPTATSTQQAKPTPTIKPSKPKDDLPEPTSTPVIILPDAPQPTTPPPLPTPTATLVNPNESVLISFDGPASLGEVSPDGNLLAFNRVQVEVEPQQNRYNQVWLLDVTSKEATKLVEEGTVGRNPVWSPDGQKLTYEISNYEEMEVRVLDIDNQNDISLLKNEDLYGYYWVNNEQIGLIRANNVDHVDLTGRVVEKKQTTDLRTTPSGNKPEVAATSHDVIVTVDSEELRVILPNGQEEKIQAGQGERIFEFDLAPDNRQIAYITSQDSGTALWVSDLTEDNQRKIYERVGGNRGRIGQPVWSPNSQSLVFIWGEYGTNPNIQLVWANVKSGKVMPLEVDTLDYNKPIFNPDGQFLYYSRTAYPDDSIWGKTTFYQMKVNQ